MHHILSIYSDNNSNNNRWWWWPNCTLIIRKKLYSVNSWIRTPIRFFTMLKKPPFFNIDVAIRRKKWTHSKYATEPVLLFLFENFNSYVGWLSSILEYFLLKLSIRFDRFSRVNRKIYDVKKRKIIKHQYNIHLLYNVNSTGGYATMMLDKLRQILRRQSMNFGFLLLLLLLRIKFELKWIYFFMNWIVLT